jgi:hypothetical protein
MNWSIYWFDDKQNNKLKASVIYCYRYLDYCEYEIMCLDKWNTNGANRFDNLFLTTGKNVEFCIYPCNAFRFSIHLIMTYLLEIIERLRR